MPISNAIREKINSLFSGNARFKSRLIQMLAKFPDDFQLDVVIALEVCDSKLDSYNLTDRQLNLAKIFQFFMSKDMLYDGSIYAILHCTNLNLAQDVLLKMELEDLFNDKYYCTSFIGGRLKDIKGKKITTIIEILTSDSPLDLVSLLIKYKNSSLLTGSNRVDNFMAMVHDNDPVSLSLEMSYGPNMNQENFDKIISERVRGSLLRINEGKTLFSQVLKDNDRDENWLDAIENEDNKSSSPKK